MPTTLSQYAVEKGTFVVRVSFTDETGTPVIPKSGLNWTLTNEAGDVVNSRSAVAITPGTSVNIVLSGDDLALVGVGSEDRVLTVEGTYDSSLGTDLSIKDECRFSVINLTRVV